MPKKELMNFRDIGGLPTNDGRKVKHGRIFRTGNIAHIDQRAAEHLAEDLKIKAYIDFRSPTEIVQFGEPKALSRAGIEWINIHIESEDPIFKLLERPLKKDWTEFYTRLFDYNLESWARFLKVIRDLDAPVMYGCLFGKDRTGIATSFLLSHLDVKRDHIYEDYSKTTTGLYPNVERLKVIWEKSTLTEQEQLEHFMKAHPEIIEDFLRHYHENSQPKLRKVLHNLEELAADLQGQLLTK